MAGSHRERSGLSVCVCVWAAYLYVCVQYMMLDYCHYPGELAPTHASQVTTTLDIQYTYMYYTDTNVYHLYNCPAEGGGGGVGGVVAGATRPCFCRLKGCWWIIQLCNIFLKEMFRCIFLSFSQGAYFMSVLEIVQSVWVSQ